MSVEITDGQKVEMYVLPDHIALYAHEGGILVLWDGKKKAHIGIDPLGMTDEEIERALSVGVEMLMRAPANRKQRRAMN